MNRLAALLMVSFIFISSLWSNSFAAQEKKEDERDKQLRLKAELVEVRAVVTDKRGQPVGNLTKDDFEVLEDNRPQVLSFFSVENIGALPDSKTPAATTTPTGPTSLRIP